jgi:hypothetical protein
MLFGHNTNIKVGETTFHVQTEDRGVATALIDTTVYHTGRVMHRRTNNYHDLIPLNTDREEALRLRLDEQHRATLEDIRSGALYLAAPPSTVKAPATTEVAVTAAVAVGQAPANGTHSPADGVRVGIDRVALKLELRNPRTWLAGKQARLEIAVTSQSGEPQPGATVTARIEGAATPEEFSSATNSEGNAEIGFVMPKLSGSDAALVVEAVQNHGEAPSPTSGRGKLRFALRTKPRPI